MNEPTLEQAIEMLEDSKDQLNLAIAEYKNDCIIQGIEPYNAYFTKSVKEAFARVSYWNLEVIKLKQNIKH